MSGGPVSRLCGGEGFLPGDAPADGTIYGRKDRKWVPVENSGGEKLVIASGSGEARSLEDRFADVLNVKDYGARGDASANDTDAFYNVDQTAKGRPVYVPAGLYRLTGYIPLSRFFGPGKLQIFAGTYNGIQLSVDPETLDQEKICLTTDGELFPLDFAIPQWLRTSCAASDGRRMYNLVLGPEAGQGLQHAGRYNAAFGHAAMRSNDKGDRNTALGQGALRDCPHPYGTDAVGADAVMCSDYVNRSSYIGSNAGKWTGCADPVGKKHDLFLPESAHLPVLEGLWPDYRSIIGPIEGPSLVAASSDANNRGNVGVGRDALIWNVVGRRCTATGYHALFGWNADACSAYGYNALTYGLEVVHCSAFGTSALHNNITGNYNSAFGSFAMGDNVHGDRNTVVGYTAAQHLTGGSADKDTARQAATINTMVGYVAGQNMVSSVGNTLLGAFAGQNADYTYAVVAGVNAGNEGKGENVVAIGHDAGRYATGNFNVLVGAFAMGIKSAAAGNRNTALGYRALGNGRDGTMCTSLGYRAGETLIDGKEATSLINVSCLGAFTAASGNNQVQLGNSDTTVYYYNLQARSDRRDKADIRPTELGLDFVLGLKPVDYRVNYRERYQEAENDGSLAGSRFHHGFIAQDVKEWADAKGIDFGGYQDHSINGGMDVRSLGYPEFIAPMVRAIQELHERLAALEAKQ